MRIFNRRSNNGTNVVESEAIYQSGYVEGPAGTGSTVAFNITFPQAYKNPPIVVASFGGDSTTGASTYGSGGPNRNNATAMAENITNTGCMIRVGTLSASAWVSGDTVFAQWIAIGN